MDKVGADKIFLGHWGNRNDIQYLRNLDHEYWDKLKGRVFRLDYSANKHDGRKEGYGIGYAILDANGDVVEFDIY